MKDFYDYLKKLYPKLDFPPFPPKKWFSTKESTIIERRNAFEVINLGSNSAWQPVPYQAVYGGSKSYVLNFSRAIGRELKPKGIHVMCVCPGWIRTEFQQVARHEQYIRYVDRWYEADEVVRCALKDLKKKKTVSILGRPVRMQVRLVKFLPVRLVMAIWCRQQGIR